MHLTRRIGIAALALASVGLIAARKPLTERGREVARIQAHFDSVLTELQSRDIRHLSAAAMGHRWSLIAELQQYRDRGEFPHNYDFPGQLVPYFVDRETGTLCAVANLLARTGRSDIVERVRVANNNVRVAQLSGDTAFVAWLDASGLTLDEAARIQVPYGSVRSSGEMKRDIAFGVVSLVAMGGSVATGIVNLTGNFDGQHSKLAKTGIVFGAISGILGTRLLTARDIPPTVGQSAIGLGIASMGLGFHSLHQRTMLAQREAAARTVTILEPTIDARGAAGARVGMSIGF